MKHLFPKFIIMAGLAVLLTAIAPQRLQAHSGKARLHLIVDTDGAADDLRTLLMLLANREAEVLAIVTSEGALSPSTTALKADALCADLYHEGIPVGVGHSVPGTAPHWRTHSEQIIWGERASSSSALPTAAELLATTLSAETSPTTYVALGALTNLRDLLLQQPELKSRLERIVWYNTSVDPLSGANYDADPQSAQWVLKCGVPVEVVAAHHERPLTVTHSLIDSIAAVGNPYARKIAATHRTPPLKRLIDRHHIEAWDDLVAVYLYAPQLFDVRRISPTVSYCTPRADALPDARRQIIRILKGRPDAETRVFYGFPTREELYSKEVRPIISVALSKYGESEWRAGVLTNELHGHLGIYATVGFKMGIRAREYFNIGVDDISVTSYAGTRPPVSCMNDGLQVAAGSTIGHGLLHAAPTDRPRPSADFTFRGKTLRLTLKQEYAERIAHDVQTGIDRYGFGTEEYWHYVRKLAIGYWLDFDRHNIFDMEVVK